MRRIAFVLGICVASLSGCAHHQLGYNTVKQADTVADVHTQQVLDNLAKFAHNPGALPHFSFPNAGQSTVNDQVGGSTGFNFSPHALTSWMFGASANRSMTEAYTMTPINDPRKLELMRCAYQRAISPCNCLPESSHCPNCELRFNNFYLGETSPKKGQQLTPDGKPVYGMFKDKIFVEYVYSEIDEYGGKVYYSLTSGLRIEGKNLKYKAVLTEDPLASATASTGKVTSHCLPVDCWFTVCKSGGLEPPKKCKLVGSYCGTKVWVPECHREQLAKLTLVILDIAYYDPPVKKSKEKEVVAFLDTEGKITTWQKAAYRVTATVSRSDSVDVVQERERKDDELNEAANAARNAFAKSLTQLDSEDFQDTTKRPDTKRMFDNVAAETASDVEIDALARDIREGTLQLTKSADEKATDAREKAIDLGLANSRLRNYYEQRRRNAVQQSAPEFYPPTPTPVPNSGLLLLDQNLRALTPNN